MNIFSKNNIDVSLKISIVIPCYNQGRYLEECVLSVIRQTLPPGEIIVVNDGSTDNTNYVADKLAKKFHEYNIHIISQKNRGLPNARNTGIESAIGEYIFTLDADDKLHKSALKTMASVLDNNSGTGLVYGNIRIFGDMNFTEKLPPFSAEWLLSGGSTSSNVMFRKKAWEEAGGYNPNMDIGYEDRDFAVGVYEKGWKLYHTGKCLTYYRKSGVSMVQTSNCYDNLLRSKIVMNHKPLYSSGAVKSAEKILNEYEEASQTGSLQNGPLVSVIFPVNNTGNMAQALSSLNSQIYRNFEIVFVLPQNACNIGKLNDSVPDIKSIHVSREKIAGKNYNKAVSSAGGDFITYIDENTVYSNDHLSSLMEYILKYGSDAVSTEGEILISIESGGGIKSKKIPAGIKGIGDTRMFSDVSFILPCILHGKNAFRRIDGFNIKMDFLHEKDFLFRFSKKCKTVQLRKQTFSVRRESGAVTSSFDKAFRILHELAFLLETKDYQTENMENHVFKMYRDELFLLTVNLPFLTLIFKLLFFPMGFAGFLLNLRGKYFSSKIAGGLVAIKRYWAKKVKKLLGMNEAVLE